MHSEKIRSYYTLTKPGIIYGNALTAFAGGMLGGNLRVQTALLIITVLGTALVIACGCVLNNIIDRKIDKHMKRTKKRALVSGDISVRAALIFATVLGSSGFALLALCTNTKTLLLGALALFTYVAVYTLAKHRTWHATLLGTIPGALPLVAGYVAATDQFDKTSLILFTIMVFWQMVHFYAIAIFRRDEYAQAKVPVVTVQHGIFVTKILMVFYVCGFLLSVVALAKFSYAGLFYTAVMFPISLWWLINVVNGLWTEDHEAWSRKIFALSLIVLLVLCLMLSINAHMP